MIMNSKATVIEHFEISDLRAVPFPLPDLLGDEEAFVERLVGPQGLSFVAEEGPPR